MTTLSNSLLAARLRHPTQVRTGPSNEVCSELVEDCRRLATNSRAYRPIALESEPAHNVAVSSLQCPATLIFARHGEVEYPPPQAWADRGGTLTSNGRRQARLLGQSLADRRVSHVWCSSLSRAVQTAEIAASHLDLSVTVREGLREFMVGDIAGQPITDDDPFAPYFGPWLDGDLNSRIPGAESGFELRDRFAAVVEEIADLHRGETVLVVSHGGILRSIVPQLFDLSGVSGQPVEPGRVGFCAKIETQVDAERRICLDWERA